MQATQVRALDAGRRVQVFLDTHAATIGTAVPASLRAKLDDAVTQFAGFQSEQGTAEGTAKGETVNQAALRTDLFQRFMVPVGRAAKIALRLAPEFPKLVVSALARRKLDFLSTANQFADAATIDEKVLIDHGLAADFLVQLHTAIAQMAASAAAQGRSVARRIAATAACGTANKTLRAVIGLLDGVLKPVLKGNTSLLVDWQASKRIRLLPVTPLPTGGTVVTPPATSPAQPTTAPVPPPATP
jgi:hypothetical protein